MENKDLIEVKTTDHQTLHIQPSAVGAVEIVPSTQHVEGHLKVFIGGFKFLIKEEPETFLKKLRQK